MPAKGCAIDPAISCLQIRQPAWISTALAVDPSAPEIDKVYGTISNTITTFGYLRPNSSFVIVWPRHAR